MSSSGVNTVSTLVVRSTMSCSIFVSLSRWPVYLLSIFFRCSSSSASFAISVLFHLGSSMFLYCRLLTMFYLSFVCRWFSFSVWSLESLLLILENRLTYSRLRFLTLFCMPTNSRRVTVFRDCVRLGWFSDSRANFPGGEPRVDSVGVESSES